MKKDYDEKVIKEFIRLKDKHLSKEQLEKIATNLLRRTVGNPTTGWREERKDYP